MKKILVILSSILMIFLLACCDLQKIGKNLEATSHNAFEESETVPKEEEVIAEAKAEAENLVSGENGIKSVIYNYFDTQTKGFASTKTDYVEVWGPVLKQFSTLAAKYADNPKAWSTIRSYLKYATLTDFPNITGTLDNGKTLQILYSNIKEDAKEKLFSIIEAVLAYSYNDDAFDDLDMVTSDTIKFAKPSVSNQLLKKSTSSKTVTVSNYNSEIMYYSSCSKSGSGSIEKVEGKDNQFTITGEDTYSIEYKIYNEYCNNDYYVWKDGKDIEKTYTVKFTAKVGTAPASTSPSLAISLKDSNNETYKSGYEFDYFNMPKGLKLFITATFDGGNIPYSLVIKKDKEEINLSSFAFDSETGSYDISSIFAPGEYSVVLSVEKTNEHDSGSKDFKFTIESTSAVTDELISSLLASVLSFYAPVVDGGTNADIVLNRTRLVDSSFNNIVKVLFDVDLSSNKSDKQVYLYSDLLNWLYFNTIVESLEKAIVGLITNNTMEVAAYGKAYNVLKYTDSSELADISVDNFCDFIKQKVKNLDFSRPHKLANLSDQDKKIIYQMRILNNYLDDAMKLLKRSDIVETLGFFLSSWKSNIKFNEIMYRLDTEKGTLDFGQDPRVKDVINSVKTGNPDIEKNKYVLAVSNLNNKLLDIDYLVDDVVKKYKAALNGEKWENE